MAKRIPKQSFSVRWDQQDPDQFIRVLEEHLRSLLTRIRTAVNNHADILDGTGDPPLTPSYTVATLPTASSWESGTIYVSDEVGGAVLAFSDGTNWRRVTDRAIVS